LQAIRRKYGSVEAAIAERDRIAELLGALEDFDAQEERLRTASREAEAALVKGAAALSAGRKRAAARFAEEVSEELRHLGMPSAELRVVLVPPEVGDSAVRVGDALYGPFGAEEARILFAPNPGEGFRPLAKIASGGELSRVLLALKSVALARAGSTSVTYLFDEIDTGIGGETAERVGIRLKALARGRQVLCVTHLAQLAGYADTHLRIRKDVRKGRTEASVTALADTEKVEELARMIGGIEVTRKSRDHAEELLRRGQTGRRSKAVLTAG
jgi:DNA repair protein RecN (Recombination protein N)